MPDPDVSPVARASGVPMDYRNAPDIATLSLRQRIVDEIASSGPMPLPRYLELALYHPALGYYAQSGHRVGARGDFFTSVSVGPVFGTLLARRMARHYEERSTPDRWRIIELGANDGRLAADVLEGLRRIHPQAMASLEYVICEPLPLLRDTQRQRLSPFGDQVRIVSSMEDLACDRLPSIVFGNEVLDALPFHLVEWRGVGWRETCVGLGENGRLQLTTGPRPGPDVLSWLEMATHGLSLPDGWQCEIRTDWRGFLQSCLRGTLAPLMIWIDYGFPRHDLILPHRTEGTWRAYRKHRIEQDPWDSPGECDLTAHVDFTGVTEAAESLGGKVTGPTAQGTWLTRLAMDDLATREGAPDPAWTRQFQTLTHPAHLGARFHVIECAWR